MEQGRNVRPKLNPVAADPDPDPDPNPDPNPMAADPDPDSDDDSTDEITYMPALSIAKAEKSNSAALWFCEWAKGWRRWNTTVKMKTCVSP